MARCHTCSYEHLASQDVSRKRKRSASSQNRPSNRHRIRLFLPEEIDRISEYEFKKMFPVSRESFQKLLNAIDPFLYTPDECTARRSSGYSMSKKTKLYCTLKWLAGGSYLDICLSFGVSQAAFASTDYKKGFVWPVMDAINEVFQIGFLVHDPIKLRETAQGFMRYTNGNMPGCISAIDGWVCKTRIRRCHGLS